MKPALIPVLFIAVLLAGANSAPAQVTLENFSSFESANTLFFGDWSNSGDPFVGDLSPASTFSQGAGFYNLASVTNADSSFVERSFTAPVNLGSNNLLSLSLRLLEDNTAESITVFLFDAGFHTAFATFQNNAFSTTTFIQQSVAFTADAGFSSSAVTSFRISGNDPFASGILSVALNDLAATDGRPIPAVPEPSAYGLLAALFLLALVYTRRFHRRC
jgi:hypothetical protein